MLNLLTKSTPWIAAALVASASVFAGPGYKNNESRQKDTQPCPPQSPQTCSSCHDLISPKTAAYNAPARIDVCGSWDVYTTGNYIYWQARQDNMGPGFIANSVTPFATVGQSYITEVDLDYQYKSGFKVGLGSNLAHDNWDLYSEYTWFHGTVDTNTTTDVNHGLFPSKGAIMGTTLAVTTPFAYRSSTSSWDLKMDLLDLSLARNYFQGTKLNLRPFFGARAAWIRQKADYTYFSDGTGFTINYTNFNTYKSTSWGVGLRTGFESNWMLGSCFRFIGNASGDALYTQYNVEISQIVRANFTGITPVPRNWQDKEDDIGTLRFHTDLELGFGWGSYFNNNNYHVDFAATYGFQTFFNQNMFRQFLFGGAGGFSISPNGNLYVHGLTATARFDF